MLQGKGIYADNEPTRTASEGQPFERPQEKVHESHTIKIERKMFSFQMRENRGGKFLRIEESANGKRDIVIVPESGISEFVAGVQKVAKL